MNLRSKKIIIAGFGVGILIVGLFITVIGTILLPKFFEERAKLNISRYEGHRYAFEIHQYT